MASDEWIEGLQKRTLELLQLVGANESPCPVCKGVKHFAMPLVVHQWTEWPGEPYPKAGATFLPLMCLGCMHTRFFLSAGLAVKSKIAEGAT